MAEPVKRHNHDALLVIKKAKIEMMAIIFLHGTVSTKDIFDSRIIINSTAKFYISISYQKDLLSIDTRIFTPSAISFLIYFFNSITLQKSCLP